MRSVEYLNEIRKGTGLERAVLKKISVEGKKVTFHLLTDLSYSPQDVAYAKEVSEKFVPEGYSGEVDLRKSVPSAEGVRGEILEILRTRFPAAAAFLSPDDVKAETDKAGGRFFLCVGGKEREQFLQEDVLSALSRELMRRFCGPWYGSFVQIEREEKEIEPEALPAEERLAAPRTFPIVGYSPIDGASPQRAVYITDVKGEQPNLVLCGRIVRIEERLTKKEKPYFRIALQDGTGQISVSYFSKKATIEKVKKLKEGDSVCLTGKQELFNGNFSVTAKSVDFGSPPEDFVPVVRPSRAVPAAYAAVKIEPAFDPVQGDFFGGEDLPEEVLARKFVVFDLETTGLTCTSDKIIEVGAVKIENGKILEKFSTFVSCPVRLSEKIVSLTGITDEMLVGAPDIKDVIADFYKFTQGCALVAHNAPFDCGFIRFAGEQEGYAFDQTVYDTLALAQERMILSNYKLNTIADRFGFQFHHHRAFDDAFVTAKIFLELMKMKNGI